MSDFDCIKFDDFQFNAQPKGKKSKRSDIENLDELNKHMNADSLRTVQRHFARRYASEGALNKTLDWYFENGNSYHCISFGDVDSLTYLRVILKQQKIRYCLLSTWCMAITDAEEICDWIKRGYIGRMDFYVGEIFEKQYSGVYKFLKENCMVKDARICVFRNHSKVIAGFGEKFDFAIESSANVNTNPRCEQSCINISTEVAKFYIDFYNQINSFNREFDNWKAFNG